MTHTSSKCGLDADAGPFRAISMIYLCQQHAPDNLTIKHALQSRLNRASPTPVTFAVRTLRAPTEPYFAPWGMPAKLSLALAVGIAFPLLDWAGGVEEGGWMLALLYGGVPIVFKRQPP